MPNESSYYKEIPVHSVGEAIYFLLQLRELDFFSFRGQRDSSWPLGPHSIPEDWVNGVTEDDSTAYSSACEEHKKRQASQSAERRDNVASNNIRSVIREHLSVYLKHCREFSGYKLNENDWWGNLIFARHQGLSTLLLDWTSNPLVALYFAVENVSSPGADAVVSASMGSSTGDGCNTGQAKDLVRGAVWAIKVLRAEDVKGPSKFQRWYEFNDLNSQFPQGEKCVHWIMINPPLNSPRIIRQSGKFSYHPHMADRNVDSRKLQPGEALVKLVIGSDEQPDPTKEIRKKLGVMAMHHGSLFPDFTGVAQYLNTQWRDIAKGHPAQNLDTAFDIKRLDSELSAIKEHCQR